MVALGSLQLNPLPAVAMALNGNDWMLCACFFVMGIFNASGATDRPFEIDVDLASTSDWQKYIRACADAKNTLSETCQTEENSCKGRCEQAIVPGTSEVKNSMNPAFCFCDSLCLVYKDCCWDYKRWCPHVHAEGITRWRPLIGAQIVCHKKRAIISDCNERDGSHRHFDSREDFREPIVSERSMGLHFKNRFIYSCYENRIDLQNMTAWQKVFRHSNFTELLPDLREYVSTGNASNLLRQRLHDEVPEGVTTRHCYAFASIRCNKDVRCTYFASLPVANLSAVCEYAEVLIHFWGSSSTLPASSKTAYSTRVVTSITTTSSIDMNSVDDPASNEYRPTCRSTLIYPVTDIRGYTEFSIIMNFDDNLNLYETHFLPDGSWDYASCVEGLIMEEEVACTPILKCQPGFVFLGGGCIEPKTLILTSESPSEAQASALMNQILTILLEEEVATMTMVKENKYITRSRGQGLTRTFQLRDYRLVHTDPFSLGLAKHLIDILREQNKGIRLGLSNNMTVTRLGLSDNMTVARLGLSDNMTVTLLGLSDNMTVCLTDNENFQCNHIFLNGVLSNDAGTNRLWPAKHDPLPSAQNCMGQAYMTLYTIEILILLHWMHRWSML